MALYELRKENSLFMYALAETKHTSKLFKKMKQQGVLNIVSVLQSPMMVMAEERQGSLQQTI